MLTAELMDAKLTAADLVDANAFAVSFGSAIKVLEQGCRTKERPAQLDGAKQARVALAQFLELAATQYTVPPVQMPYSSFRP